MAEPLADTALDADSDLIELYFARGWTDGLPVVPPTTAKVAPPSPHSAAIRSSSSAGSHRGGAS